MAVPGSTLNFPVCPSSWPLLLRAVHSVSGSGPGRRHNSRCRVGGGGWGQQNKTNNLCSPTPASCGTLTSAPIPSHLPCPSSAPCGGWFLLSQKHNQCRRSGLAGTVWGGGDTTVVMGPTAAGGSPERGQLFNQWPSRLSINGLSYPIPSLLGVWLDHDSVSGVTVI